MNSTESIPQVWNDEHDGQFFRITASLFTRAYCCGASVLLASYDPDDAFTAAADTQAQTAPTPSAMQTAASAVDSRSRTQHTAH